VPRPGARATPGGLGQGSDCTAHPSGDRHLGWLAPTSSGLATGREGPGAVGRGAAVRHARIAETRQAGNHRDRSASPGSGGTRSRPGSLRICAIPMCCVTTGRPSRSPVGSRRRVAGSRRVAGPPQCAGVVPTAPAAAARTAALGLDRERRWRVDTGGTRPGLAPSRAVGRRCGLDRDDGPGRRRGSTVRRQSAAIAWWRLLGGRRSRAWARTWRSRQVGRRAEIVGDHGGPPLGSVGLRELALALASAYYCASSAPRRNYLPDCGCEGSPAPPGPVTGHVTAERVGIGVCGAEPDSIRVPLPNSPFRED
jgi:hypothetical protein